MNDAMPNYSNPFFFESPSDRWSFTDRDELMEELGKFLKQKGRRLLVHGLRRMGKTSLLLNAGRLSGERFVFVDVSAATNLNEVAKKLLAAAPAEEESLLPKLVRLARTFLSSVSISAGGVELSGELRMEDGQKNFESVLSYLNARAGVEDRPWTVCLDEFQDLRILAGERVDWQIRSLIQEHRNVNYIFSGSDNRLVRWMSEPNAAFFRQLQMMEVGAIETEHLAGWLAQRSKIGGLARFPYAKGIIEKAGPRTGDVIRLAMSCFEIATAGKGKFSEESVVPDAMNLLAFKHFAPEFSAQWRECNLVQRAVLRAISQDCPPTAIDTIRKFGIRSPSTAHSAVKTLLDRQILVQDEAEGVVFDNPFFRHWVAANGSDLSEAQLRLHETFPVKDGEIFAR